MAHFFPFDLTTANPLVLGFLSAYNNVEYGIPVDIEANEIVSYVIGSPPSKDIAIGLPIIIGLNPNIAFNSLSL